MCAAYVAHMHFLNNADYHPAQYGTDPPDVRGREVYVIDFSYKRPVMEQIRKECARLVVLDHHKTAEADLAGFGDGDPTTTVVFDMDRSGAGIAWDWFFGGSEDARRPELVKYVEDRDLWRHALPYSVEINAYISILKFDFGEWRQALSLLETNFAEVVTMGKLIHRKTEQYVAAVCSNARRVRFQVYDDVYDDIPVVNAPQIDVSEVGDHLCQGVPFSVAWWQRADGLYQFSLRSRGDSGVDVSEIAKVFGGGGHRNAAGFQHAMMPF